MSGHPLGGGAAARTGARLRALRLQRGLTLNQVAAPLGVTNSCISQWEKGRSFPGGDYLEPLADTLSTTVAYLVTGEGESDATSPRTLPTDLSAADVIDRARREIADALGLAMDEVRVEIGREAIAGESVFDPVTNASAATVPS